MSRAEEFEAQNSILLDDLPDPEPTQAISASNISPTKLMLLLRTKFGAGSYDIHVR